jgi:hypothetical protein
MIVTDLNQSPYCAPFSLLEQHAAGDLMVNVEWLWRQLNAIAGLVLPAYAAPSAAPQTHSRLAHPHSDRWCVITLGV